MQTFSVIILHYNQPQYIKTAIDSVLSQDYGAIELIIADDHSAVFDEIGIQDYIANKASENLISVKIITSEENLGTTKNVNAGIKASTGELVMFFAADDALFDSSILTRFASELTMLPSDRHIIAAQCLMYDEKLERILEKFVDERRAQRMNLNSSSEQFDAFSTSCFYAIGATAFKRKMIESLNWFDERYVYIEDWPFFLKLTRLGNKIKFVSFPALKHRDGGISHHNNLNELPVHVVKYHDDISSIQENEIIPYLKSLSPSRQLRVLTDYYKGRKDLFSIAGRTHRRSIAGLILENPKAHFKLFFFIWMEHKHEVENFSIKIVAPAAIALTLLLSNMSSSQTSVILFFGWSMIFIIGLCILVSTLFISQLYLMYSYLKPGKLEE